MFLECVKPWSDCASLNQSPIIKCPDTLQPQRSCQESQRSFRFMFKMYLRIYIEFKYIKNKNLFNFGTRFDEDMRGFDSTVRFLFISRICIHINIGLVSGLMSPNHVSKNLISLLLIPTYEKEVTSDRKIIHLPAVKRKTSVRSAVVPLQTLSVQLRSAYLKQRKMFNKRAH